MYGLHRVLTWNFVFIYRGIQDSSNTLKQFEYIYIN
jgi:hypothetical protein